MAATQQIKPGKAGIWIGILLIVLSLGSCFGGVVLAGVEVADAIDNADKIPVGNDQVYDFGENANGLILAFGDTQSEANDVDATLIGPDGNEVDIDKSASLPSGTEASSDTDSVDIVGTFEATEAGEYTLSTSGPDGSSAAILKLSLSSVVTKAVGGLGLGALLFLIGLILLIVTIVRRGKAKKRIAASGGFVPPMGGQSPPPPGMPSAPPAPGMAPPAPGYAPPPAPGMAPPAPQYTPPAAPAAPPAPAGPPQWTPDAPPAPAPWSPDAPSAPPAPQSPPPPPAPGQWGNDVPPPPPPFGS